MIWKVLEEMILVVNIREGHLVILPDGCTGHVVDVIDGIDGPELKIWFRDSNHPDAHMDPSEVKITGWVMPEWMEEYRIYLEQFTGGNPIEELMNDHHTTIIGNAPRSMICVSLKGAMSMLEKLHANEHLKTS